MQYVYIQKKDDHFGNDLREDFSFLYPYKEKPLTLCIGNSNTKKG